MIKDLNFWIGARQVGKTNEAIAMFSSIYNNTPNVFVIAPHKRMAARIDKRMPLYNQKNSPVFCMTEFNKLNQAVRGIQLKEPVHLIFDEYFMLDIDWKKKVHDFLVSDPHMIHVHIYGTPSYLYSKSVLDWAEFIHSEKKVPKDNGQPILRSHFYSLLSHPKAKVNPLSSNQMLYLDDKWFKELKNNSKDEIQAEIFATDCLGCLYIIDY